MKTRHYSIDIKADRQTVWNTMLDDLTYRMWTKEFHAGSYYEGNWEKGSEIRFMAPDDKGDVSGMYSFIKENKPFEFISIEHTGIIKDGIVDTTSDEVTKWAGSHENYTFTSDGSLTRLSIDLDVEDEYETMFDEMYPRALKVLKDLCER